MKFDGYRCIAVKRGREVTLFSRHEKVLNKRFPTCHDRSRRARGALQLIKRSASCETPRPSFVELLRFTAIVTTLVRDEEYRRFQNELIEDPERGDLIRGTGGFRKARMRLAGGGKSGGARVIYLYLAEQK